MDVSKIINMVNNRLKDTKVDDEALKPRKTPNNMKRIHSNSIGLIFKFDSKEKRDKFANEPNYFSLIGALSSLAKEFLNKGMEIIFNP